MDESIHSIIPSQAMPRWTKLDNTDQLVELHRRFWLEGAHRDDLVNVHEDEVADQSNEDESIEEDDDHGIRSGYVLDLGMAFRHSNVLVRKEYIRMYSRCTQHLDAKTSKRKRTKQNAPSVVITGQPGIGRCLAS